MNIAFDASDLCTGRADGTTRYTTELAKRLPEMAKNTQWDFYGPCPKPAISSLSFQLSSLPNGKTGRNQRGPGSLPTGRQAESKSGMTNATWHNSPSPFAWTQTSFAYELLKDRPDVLFMPIQQLPILRWPNMKTVTVIHDLAFHEYSTQFRYKDWLLLHTFSAQVAREADMIIAVSEATKQDIKKYYGREHNVRVVHHGIDHDRFKVFSKEEKKEGLQKLQEKYPKINAPYILFVGQIQPRKNIVRLVEAFEKLHINSTSNLKLVIAGGHGWNNEEIYKRIHESPVREHIIVTGAVPDELLPTLYASAEVFILPSLQEGFGIPLLEASACGTPTVTSNCSSMKEVMEGASVLTDPLSSKSIAEGISDALARRSELSKKAVERARQFSWDVTATQTLAVLKEVTNL